MAARRATRRSRRDAGRRDAAARPARGPRAARRLPRRRSRRGPAGAPSSARAPRPRGADRGRAARDRRRRARARSRSEPVRAGREAPLLFACRTGHDTVSRMAAREPAHPIEKRDILHANPPNVARVKAIAQKLAAEGRWPEAIDYIEIVPEQALLDKARTHAIETGAVWLLQQVERISGTKAEPAQWLQLSDSAGRAERWRDAVR